MMRITNGMMMNTTKLNINSNKVSVDRLNTQMSTQKKITKPSDNPLIAIKSLRLSTTLSQINQYCTNNITDAQSWMDVTETALTNMKDALKDAYRLCVQGSTDTLSDVDRNTILTQLKGLSTQLYSEANADYADRTVFSGYKTNSTVAFTDGFEATQAKYQIYERLSASDIEEYTYYANQLDTPTANEVNNPAANPVKTPQEEVLKRLRLSYSKQTKINSFSYDYSVDTTAGVGTGTTTGNVTIKATVDPAEQTFQWRSHRKDSTFTYDATAEGKMTGVTLKEMNGYELNISTTGVFSIGNADITPMARTTTIDGVTTTHYTFIDAAGNTIFEAQDSVDKNKVRTAFIADSQGNRIELSYSGTDPNTTLEKVKDPQGNVINTNLKGTFAQIDVKKADGTIAMTAKPGYIDGADPTKGTQYEVYTGDKKLTTALKMETMTQPQFDEYLSDLAKDPDTMSEKYKDTVIYLPDSGELVFGTNIAQMMSSEFATLNVDYDKEGFEKGETRPEMYFNCVNKTDPSAVNHIKYTNFDADNNWIAQNIDYAVSANQDLTINTQIHDVLSADCYRDLAEMTNIVQDTINAHTAVSNIEAMLASTDYVAEDKQAYLKDCLEKAKKQAAYMDDHLQKVFGKQITHFENYQNKVNLAITDVGSRGDQLALAENRISSQKTTFTQLKSSNEDEELSDVTIDYTSAFTAYQASLQAAGKIDDMSLLDYL